MKIKYRKLTVEVEGERPKKCSICGKEFKKIDLHHFKYEFTTEQVRKNPQLALKNTIPVCYYDHRIADAIRKVMDNPERSKKIAKLLKSYKYFKGIKL